MVVVAPNSDAETELARLLAQGNVVVLSGAGISTDSGIPDYRDANGEWKRKRPVEYRDFVGSESTRRRYWARSLVGFPHFVQALPNRAHHGVTKLEAMGLLSLTITQNVDGLHQRAGSRNVIDLHGRLDRVVCLSCKDETSREALQTELTRLNPDFAERVARVAPDGDADLDDLDTSRFEIVACARCDGVLKPHVVFFGETVPKERVERAYAAVESARALLIVGSSLMVFSGYRFARAAAKRGLSLAIVNQGKTRADADARIKIEDNAGAVLSRVVAALGSA